MYDSTTVNGVKVILIPGKCLLSSGIYWATLDVAKQTERLYTRFDTAHIPVSPHTLLLISQWAAARGFKKERHVIKKKDRRRIGATTGDQRHATGSRSDGT